MRPSAARLAVKEYAERSGAVWASSVFAAVPKVLSTLGSPERQVRRTGSCHATVTAPILDRNPRLAGHAVSGHAGGGHPDSARASA